MKINNRGYLLILLTVFLLSIFFYHTSSLIWHKEKFNFVDFKVYYFAAKIVKQGENPYKTSLIKQELEKAGYPKDATRFLYPIFWALAFIPLTLLKVTWAARLWLLFNVILLFACLFILIKITNKKISWQWILLGVFLIFYFRPLLYTLKLGQVNFVIFILLLLSLYLFINSKNKNIYKYLAGVFIGIASVIKIFPAIFIGFYLVKKQYKIVLASLLMIVILFAGSGLAVGFDKDIQFFTKKMPRLSAGTFSALDKPSNVSLAGVFYRTMKENRYVKNTFNVSQENISLFSTAVSLIIIIASFLFIFFRKSKNKKLLILEFSLIILLCVIAPKNVRTHYLLFSILPLFVSFYYIFKYIKQKYNKIILYLLWLLSFVLIAVPLSLVRTILGDFRTENKIGAFIAAPNIYGSILLFVIILILIWQLGKQNQFLKKTD